MVSVEQSAIRDLRARLFEHLHELSLAFFDSRRTGMLVSRITNDLEYLRASLAAGISNLIKDSLTLLVCLAWVFAASWQLALFSLLVLPPVAFALVTIGRKMRKRSTRAQERMADMTSILQETIVGARIVKAFGMERFESDRFGRANDGFRDAFVRLRRVSAAARPVSEYAIVVVAVAMLWFGGRQIFVNHAAVRAVRDRAAQHDVAPQEPVRGQRERAAGHRRGGPGVRSARYAGVDRGCAGRASVAAVRA
jgi:subfamily B ATP-binding cassette protein MsbA